MGGSRGYGWCRILWVTGKDGGCVAIVLEKLAIRAFDRDFVQTFFDSGSRNVPAFLNTARKLRLFR